MTLRVATDRYALCHRRPMLIPYNTDAPIYHLPIVTLNMIVINIAVFFGVLYLSADMSEEGYVEMVTPWILEYGNGLRPWQWVTSCFMHADFLHLLGNMFCLWGFGLVVEGKVGWWRFLLIFLGMGVSQNIIEQTLMLFADGGGSLGASSIVYGLLVIAMLWAPENEMSCLFLFFFRFIHFEMKLSALAGYALFLELAVGMLSGMRISSQVLHLMGAAAGFGVGYVMLKKGWVDCEGWDFFTVRAGGKKTHEVEEDEAQALLARASDQQLKQHLATSSVPIAAAPTEPLPRQAADAPLKLDVEDTPPADLDAVRSALDAGNATAALAIYRQLAKSKRKPPERELLQIITQLHEQQQWSASIPAIRYYLKRFQVQNSRLRLRLAHILIDVENRPRQAAHVLTKVVETELAAEELETLERLKSKAQSERANVANEAAVQDW